MIWLHDKVVWQRTSRATSHLFFISTVWWYNILYHTPCIRQATFVNFQRKTYIMLDKTQSPYVTELTYHNNLALATKSISMVTELTLLQLLPGLNQTSFCLHGYLNNWSICKKIQKIWKYYYWFSNIIYTLYMYKKKPFKLEIARLQKGSMG
jgi:hypothetical protein